MKKTARRPMKISLWHLLMPIRCQKGIFSVGANLVFAQHPGEHKVRPYMSIAF
jgi:hypothetical protein